MGDKKPHARFWDILFAIGMCFAVALLALMIVWNMTHPSRTDIAKCNSAGYPVVIQDFFSYDVFCQKTVIVPLSEVEKESK